MAFNFSDIPLRNNGDRVDNTWFDFLRLAGLSLQNFFGNGYLAETNFAVANGAAVAADVTGLLFDATKYKGAQVWASVRRKTASSEVCSMVRLNLFYRDLTAAWDIVAEENGDASGVTFSITSAGQVQYTSSTIAGTGYTGLMRFKAVSFAA